MVFYTGSPKRAPQRPSDAVPRRAQMRPRSNSLIAPTALARRLGAIDCVAEVRFGAFAKRRPSIGVLCLFILAVLVVSRPASASDKTTIRRFAIAPHRVLELQVPSAWSAIVRKRPDHSILNIVFGPMRGIPFEVTLAPSPEATPTDAALRERALHDSVDRLANAIKGHATTSELKIVKLDVSGGAGLCAPRKSSTSVRSASPSLSTCPIWPTPARFCSATTP